MSGRLTVLVIAGSFYISNNGETYVIGQGPAVLCWQQVRDGRTGLYFFSNLSCRSFPGRPLDMTEIICYPLGRGRCQLLLISNG